MKKKGIKFICVLLLTFIVFGIVWIIINHNLTIFDKIEKTDKILLRNNFDSEKNLLIEDLNKIADIIDIIKKETMNGIRKRV